MATPSKHPYSSIDEYIALQPQDQREGLELMRYTILKAAPGTEEVISYGMPGFKLNGILVENVPFAIAMLLLVPVRLKGIGKTTGPLIVEMLANSKFGTGGLFMDAGSLSAEKLTSCAVTFITPPGFAIKPLILRKLPGM